MRAIWKGHIRFSLVTIPIRIYSAIESSKSISFNLLSKDNKNPVSYEKKDKVTGETLRKEDIVKGYQYEPGQYVILESEDFEKVKINTTKVIELEGFVKEEDVHPMLFDSPYFAGPDGEIGIKTYNLLKRALEDSGKVGVGKVVLRDRENVVLLAPQDQGIVLYKLRDQEEIRNMDQVPNLDQDVDIDHDQLDLAHTLIDKMTRNFSDLDLTDRYKEALKEMIEAKIQGEEVVSIGEEEEPVTDIMSALKESIERAKKDKKPMEKASGKKSTKKSKSSGSKSA